MRELQEINFKNFESRKRAALINCLSGFKSANLIGTSSKEGLDNLSIVSSCFHIGANPALIGMIIRPSTSERSRHTFDNIIETQLCTLNHVNEKIIDKSHQTSARYSREQSEFEQVGLTALKREGHSAPYVLESYVQLGLALREHQHLKINGCEMLILEILHLYTDESWIKGDGFLDVESAGSVCVSGLDCYHKTQQISRLSYAKPDRWPVALDINGSEIGNKLTENS